MQAETVQPGLLKSLPKLLRIKQWAKNFFVLAAIIFTGEFDKPDLLTKAIIAFFAFSFISSATYVFNDLADVEKDRLHPKKKLRPIASGAVTKPLAVVIGVISGLAGLAMSAALNPIALSIVVIYILTQIAYNLKLKRVAVADVFTIAFGFVLRAAMGAAAIAVPMSGWLFICTGFISLMLGFAKRRNEFLMQGTGKSETRSSLDAYNQLFLDVTVAVTAGMATMGYAIYSMASKTAHSYPGIVLTLPFVMYGICRYLLLVYKKNSGGEPADILFGDKHIAITIAGFIIAAAIAISNKLPIGDFIVQ